MLDIYLEPNTDGEGKIFHNGKLSHIEGDGQKIQLVRNIFKIKKGEFPYFKNVGFDWLESLNLEEKQASNKLLNDILLTLNTLGLSLESNAINLEREGETLKAHIRFNSSHFEITHKEN